MKRFIFPTILLLFAANTLLAQKTFVPDTNLRKILVNFYPAYMDGFGNIVDAKASTYTGFINCQSQNVKDLTGIWKFTGIISLVCQNNSITNLDSLNKFSNLNSLYCFQNQITRLPNVLFLPKLSYLSCSENMLTSMPDLGNLLALTYLDCGKNSIRVLKGLNKLSNLQTLYVNNNKIDSLPNLSNLIKLQKFYCDNNNLSQLQGLNQLVQLTTLEAGNNQFDSLPGLSNLTKLNLLTLNFCKFTKMPNVDKMPGLNHLTLKGNNINSISSFSGNPNLVYLDLSKNLISKFPDLSVCKNTIKVLRLNDNKLDSLPNFSAFTTLDTVEVQNNRLTFEDIIPLTQKAGIVELHYAPQDSVGSNQSLILTEHQSFKIGLGIDKDVSGNQYTWFKNGKFIATSLNDTLALSMIQMSDSGVYYCQVKNSLAPLLTLTSYHFKLKVKSCMNISGLTFTSTDFDCNVGGTLNLNDETIIGGKKPFTFKLISTDLGVIHYANFSRFSNLFESSYHLEVKDQAGCKTVYPYTITIKGKKGSDCQRLVILDNDNSANNALYLEEKGTAKVYDGEGQLIQSFNTPKSWDGKNKNGQFLPGFYVIDLNGKLLNVTLIK